MSSRKEPQFFNSDDNDVVVTVLAEYEQLFRHATPDHVAVGEASTAYLFSERAVPNICAYQRDARFIVCLRNPVDMAPSLHEQQVVNGEEHILNFEEAWTLCDERLQGRATMPSCREPKRLAYGAVCQVGSQLARVYKRVARTRVLPVVLDDMRTDPRGQFLRVLEFLGVGDDRRQIFPIHNPAKEVRSPRLGRAIRLLGRTKRAIGVSRGLGLLNSLARRNLRARPREPMLRSLRVELQEYFAPDVARLSKLLDRDLSAWLDP